MYHNFLYGEPQEEDELAGDHHDDPSMNPNPNHSRQAFHPDQFTNSISASSSPAPQLQAHPYYMQQQQHDFDSEFERRRSEAVAGPSRSGPQYPVGHGSAHKKMSLENMMGSEQPHPGAFEAKKEDVEGDRMEVDS